MKEFPIISRKEAYEKGLKYYYSGELCYKAGHKAPKRVKYYNCLECSSKHIVEFLRNQLDEESDFWSILNITKDMNLMRLPIKRVNQLFRDGDFDRFSEHYCGSDDFPDNKHAIFDLSSTERSVFDHPLIYSMIPSTSSEIRYTSPLLPGWLQFIEDIKKIKPIITYYRLVGGICVELTKCERERLFE